MAIQLFVPTFDVDACLSEIRECLEKGWTGMGFKTVAFEDKWKEYTGLPHAHFLGSATVGLEMAFEILKRENGWSDGDEVITTPLTFVSSNHAILLQGLKPIFADIDDTNCLDPKSVLERITSRTKAVLFVGMGGNTGEYPEIVKICREHGLKLVLDAAHMAGTRIDGKIPGADADVVVYSFQAVKNLPTADSGMICFAKAEYDAIVRKLSWLGINKDTYSRVGDKASYKWRYDVEYVGHKNHGNSIMASIGLVQLKHLDRDNAYRRQISSWYEEGFAKYSDKIKLIRIPANCESSRHLFQIVVEKRDELMLALNAQEIYPGVHYIDNTGYRMYSYAAGTCKQSEYISEHVLSLPVHMRLSYEDVQKVIKAVVENI